MVNDAAVSNFAQNHGDILGVLKMPKRGEELIHASTRENVVNALIEERIERVPTEPKKPLQAQRRLASFLGTLSFSSRSSVPLLLRRQAIKTTL